jgi:predicted RNase H-like HicB family nuclease
MLNKLIEDFSHLKLDDKEYAIDIIKKQLIDAKRSAIAKRAGKAKTNLKKGMTKYEIIIYWSEEDKAFIAEVPELPGCMADGKTYQKALSSAEVIIKEWLETAKELGRPIPQPKGRLMYA